MMKKKYFILVPFLFLALGCFGQERISEEINESKQKSQQLTYAPEMPLVGSYSIVLNNRNVILSDEQLLEMNKHRRYDKSVEWKINDDLIVLLNPFKQ